MGFAIKSKDHYDSRVGKRIPTNVVLIRSGGPELSWGLLRPFPNLLKVKVTSARPIKTQCTFVGRIIVEVTFQEAHLLSIILCLPFVLETRRYDNCSNPNGPRDLYLFLRLNRSMKISNGGRFFCFWSISLYFERKDKWWHKGSRSKRDVRPFDCWIRLSPFTDSSGEDNRGLHSHEIPLGELQIFSVFDYPVPLPNVVHCISITLSNKVKSWCLCNSQLFTQLQAYEI